jgi:hypothetical protein
MRNRELAVIGEDVNIDNPSQRRSSGGRDGIIPGSTDVSQEHQFVPALSKRSLARRPFQFSICFVLAISTVTSDLLKSK